MNREISFPPSYPHDSALNFDENQFRNGIFDTPTSNQNLFYNEEDRLYNLNEEFSQQNPPPLKRASHSIQSNRPAANNLISEENLNDPIILLNQSYSYPSNEEQYNNHSQVHLAHEDQQHNQNIHYSHLNERHQQQEENEVKNYLGSLEQRNLQGEFNARDNYYQYDHFMRSNNESRSQFDSINRQDQELEFQPNRFYKMEDFLDSSQQVHSSQPLFHQPLSSRGTVEPQSESTHCSSDKIESNTNSDKLKKERSQSTSRNPTATIEEIDSDEMIIPNPKGSDDSSLYTADEISQSSMNKRFQKLKTKSIKIKEKPQEAKVYTEEDLDAEIEDKVNQNEKVKEMQAELQHLKTQNLNKKDLQIQRNRITAQLSRDRKKIETEFLREEIIAMKQQMRQLQQEISHGNAFCPNCCNQLIQQFNLQPNRKKTRVNSTSAQQSLQFEASPEDYLPKSKLYKGTNSLTSILSKRSYESTYIDYHHQISRGSSSSYSNYSSNPKLAGALLFTALVAVVCLVQHQPPMPSGLDNLNLQQNIHNEAYVKQSGGRALYDNNKVLQRQNPLLHYELMQSSSAIQLKDEYLASLIEMTNSDDYSTNSNDDNTIYPLMSLEDDGLTRIQDLRDIYLDRQSSEYFQYISNEFKEQQNEHAYQHYKIVDFINDEEQLYFIKPIVRKNPNRFEKESLPDYFNSEIQRSPFQLDDDDDENNDLAKFQKMNEGKKFLEENTPNKQRINNREDQRSSLSNEGDLKVQLSSVTASLMCPNSQMIIPNQYMNSKDDEADNKKQDHNLLKEQSFDRYNLDKWQYLHIILETEQILMLKPSVLNGLYSEGLYGDNRPRMIEAKCKIEDINYIYDDFVSTASSQEL